MASNIFQHIQEYISGLLRPRLFPVEYSGVITDPYISSVIVLLHCDGANGGALVDETGKTWTVFTGAGINTATKKFGTAAFDLDGITGYAKSDDHADFALGSNDWTIECWYREASHGATRQIIGQHTTAGVVDSAFILYSDTGVPTLSVYVGGTTYTVTSAVTGLSLDTWHHVAAVRDGGTLRLFVNGTAAGTTAIAGAVNNSVDPMAIGTIMGLGVPSLGIYFHGIVDDVRITRGVARYTAAFTPPTAAFPNT